MFIAFEACYQPDYTEECASNDELQEFLGKHEIVIVTQKTDVNIENNALNYNPKWSDNNDNTIHYPLRS